MPLSWSLQSLHVMSGQLKSCPRKKDTALKPVDVILFRYKASMA
jgi:hypothetical protein